MDDRTERFLETAVEREWITSDQVEECKRIHETVAEVGIDQPIEEILVKKGYLTPDRVRQLNRELSVMKVGKYQILEKLGEGGAGIVYKANQEPLERVVAIKVLSRRRIGSEKYVERFLREARVAVTLNHQNIVRGLDYGEADGYHYFVMEYVEGESLYQVLRKEGVLAEKRAFDISLRVVAALQHAAQYDLVHRDIKPENILITPEGGVKLCDLGLAKPSLVETAQASRDGTTIGTPTYMSPEQIRGKDDADFRSDVYSLGATIYHMVTGQPPFSGESADIIVRKHLRESPTDPRELNVKLSASAAAIILKMLAKRPEERYGSLDDLAEDFKALLDGRPPTHTISLGQKGPPPKVHLDSEEAAARRLHRAERQKKSKAPAMIGIAVAIVALGGLAFFALRPSKPSRPAPNEGASSRAEGPPKPDVESLSQDLYLKGVDFLTEHPDASFDSKVERFQIVVDKYPQTHWGLVAGDRIRSLREEETAAKKAHAEKAKQLFDRRVEESASLVKTGQYGAAIKALAGLPHGYEDTEYPDKLQQERERVAAEADQKKKEVLEEADSLARAGHFDRAVAELEKLGESGIPEIETAIHQKLAAIREQKETEAKARARGRQIYRAVVGTSFLKAADGDFTEAENDLVQAGGRSELVYFGTELNQAWKDVRAAREFDTAMRKGAEALKGQVEKFTLLDPARPFAGGKVLGTNEAGIRLSRGAAEEVIPYGDLSPSDRLRIAFRVLDENDPQSHMRAAFYLLVNGYMQESEAESRAAALLGAATGPFESARNLFVEYLKARADVDLLKAEGFRSRDQLEQARALLAETAARTPWYGMARYRYGAILSNLERWSEALPELERALDLGVTEPMLQYYLGEACYHANRPEDALRHFSQFADQAKSDPAILEKVRGRINDLRDKALKARIEELGQQARDAYRKEKFEEAIEHYSKLNELSPNAEDCLYYLGRANLELGRIVDAYHWFRESLKADPSGRRASDARKKVRTLEKDYAENADSMKALQNGRTAYDAGQVEVALTYYDRAIELGPLNGEAYYSRYLARLLKGQNTGDANAFEGALKDLDAVETFNPDPSLVYEGRALVYYYLKRYDDALANAKKAIEKLPDHWQAYNIAGLVHHIRGDDEGAVKFYDQGLAKSPDEVTLYMNRALAYEGLERYDEAVKDLKSASGKKPSAAQIEQIGKDLDRILKKQKGD